MKKIILKILYLMFSILWKLYIKKHKPIVIWITWSVWKTSCRMIVYQVLRQFLDDKNIYTSPKNFNSELWLVFSIFKLEKYDSWIKNLIKIYFSFIKKLIFWKKQYDILILEYWIDHPWDMDFLLNIVKPDYSVFTKLDYIHVENFKSKKDIWEEKIKLINNTKIKSFLNKKDEYLNEVSTKLLVNYSFFNKKDNYKHKYVSENKKILSLIKIWNFSIKTNVMWDDNFVYLELSLKILKSFWVEFIPQNSYIHLVNQPGRFNLFNWIKWNILIDSTYNAWPASMLKMIENTVYLRDSIFKKYDILFVIWDMRELWVSAKNEHKKLYKYLISNWKIISVWKETGKYFWKHLWNFKYASEAWLFLKDYLENTEKKYIILFKWSQNTIFTEEALKQVLKNKENEKKLVRQDEYWIKIKNNY